MWSKSRSLIPVICVVLLLSSIGWSNGEVAIKKADKGWTVKADKYEAVVAENGYVRTITSNKVQLLDLIDTVGSLGVFLWKDQLVGLSEVKQDGSTFSAIGEQASLTFEYQPSAIVFTISSNVATFLQFFIVLSPTVNVVRINDGRYSGVPREFIEARETDWFYGKKKIHITGLSRIWGPWTTENSVCEATLGAQETRKVVMEFSDASEDENREVTNILGGEPEKEPIVITSPREYQVFQRNERNCATVEISGEVGINSRNVRYRLISLSQEIKLPEDWVELECKGKKRRFSKELELPAGGWYQIEVNCMDGENVIAGTKLYHFGVGEVFVGAGQSNSTNCGEGLSKTETRMVSSFDGTEWRIANDPQPGCHDKSVNGSFWPAFGDAMYQKYKVPIGVAVTGHDGTNVSQWKPGGDLYKWLMARVNLLGKKGCRAILWHQGESDARCKTDFYYSAMVKMIKASIKDAGWKIPWMVAQVSYLNPDNPSFPEIRAAQKMLWDKGIALEGPDTDSLVGDLRSVGGLGIHFSAKGLKEHGELWATKVSVWLDEVLAK